MEKVITFAQAEKRTQTAHLMQIGAVSAVQHYAYLELYNTHTSPYSIHMEDTAPLHVY